MLSVEVAGATAVVSLVLGVPLAFVLARGRSRMGVALLDRNALGLDVTMFAQVKLATTGRDAIAKFEEARKLFESA